MSLRDAQQRVDAWISQFEEGYFHPLTNLCRLSEEVGELAREVNHRFGQKTKKKDEPEGDMGMEMATTSELLGDLMKKRSTRNATNIAWIPVE